MASASSGANRCFRKSAIHASLDWAWRSLDYLWPLIRAAQGVAVPRRPPLFVIRTTGVGRETTLSGVIRKRDGTAVDFDPFKGVNPLVDHDVDWFAPMGRL